MTTYLNFQKQKQMALFKFEQFIFQYNALIHDKLNFKFYNHNLLFEIAFVVTKDFSNKACFSSMETKKILFVIYL